MTTSEAIELLSHLFMLRTLSDMADDYNEALCMAIDALQDEQDVVYMHPATVWNSDEEELAQIAIELLSDKIAQRVAKRSTVVKELDTISGYYVFTLHGTEDYGKRYKQREVLHHKTGK